MGLHSGELFGQNNGLRIHRPEVEIRVFHAVANFIFYFLFDIAQIKSACIFKISIYSVSTKSLRGFEKLWRGNKLS
jgi:hypothetical protein